jgi:hypothetical protein
MPRQGVAPNTTYERTIHWDGSFRFWDHSTLERGENWSLTTYWAAAGQWNLSYGFNSGTSYDVERHTHLDVKAGERNADAAVSPERCTFAAATPANLTLESSTALASLSDTITFWANYTLDLDQAGCRLVLWTPVLEVKGADSAFSVTPSCGWRSSGTSMTLIETDETSVPGHLVFRWDGAAAASCPTDRAAPHAADDYRAVFVPSQGTAQQFDFAKPPWPYVDVTRTQGP